MFIIKHVSLCLRITGWCDEEQNNHLSSLSSMELQFCNIDEIMQDVEIMMKINKIQYNFDSAWCLVLETHIIIMQCLSNDNTRLLVTTTSSRVYSYYQSVVASSLFIIILNSQHSKLCNFVAMIICFSSSTYILCLHLWITIFRSD